MSQSLISESRELDVVTAETRSKISWERCAATTLSCKKIEGNNSEEVGWSDRLTHEMWDIKETKTQVRNGRGWNSVGRKWSALEEVIILKANLQSNPSNLHQKHVADVFVTVGQEMCAS